MLRKPWGGFSCANALDVALLLRHAPIESLPGLPPVWGAETERIKVLRQRGFEVWSWDLHGVSFSPPGEKPPNVLFREWAFYDAILATVDDPEPITERMPQSIGSAPQSSL